MKSPFKFLDSYTKDDREIFFGREREIEELYHRVFESKIMLVYGVSGTGKSSLIHCGLANKFQDTDWLPLVIRRGGNIIESMSAAIKAASITAQQAHLVTPPDFKKSVRSLYLDYYKPVFFIFDQFEELFIFGDKEERRAFIHIVKTLTESDLQCRMIFVMREEYMAGVSEFEKFIPTFFSNKVRIEKMSHRNALEAIKGPCKAFNISLEEGFAESLLEKLSPGSEDVELTYMQVFLDKIFRLAIGSLPPSSPAFTLALLQKTGNVSDLLGSFLDEQLTLLDNPEECMAVLKSFVSVKGSRRQINLEEISEYTQAFDHHVKGPVLKELIRTFVNLRILHDKDQNEKYELRHDALATKIYENISLIEKDILEIRQFIDNAFRSYKKRGVFLSSDDLNYIAPYESRLFLSKELSGFIDESKVRLTRAKRRRRNIVSASAIALFAVLAGFTMWAINEKNKADKAGIRQLESILKLNENFEKVKKNQTQSKVELYQMFEMSYLTHPDKLRGLWDKARAIREASDELTDYIYQLEYKMLSETEKISLDSAKKINLEIIRNKDNSQVPYQVLFETDKKGEVSKVFQLKNKVADYRKTIFDQIEKKDQDKINFSIDTERTFLNADGDSVSWEDANFRETILAAAITNLNNLITEINYIELDAINLIYSWISFRSFSFNTIHPVVIPQSTYVIAGGKFRASLLLSAYDTRTNMEAYLFEGNILNKNGGPTDADFQITPDMIPLTSVGGKTEITLPARKSGVTNYSGFIVVKTPDGNSEKFFFSDQFYVGEPTIAISPVGGNVLYRGIDNLLDITIPGVSQDKISYMVSNGVITNSEGRLTFRTDQGGTTEITVTAVIDEVSTTFPPLKFRIVDTPDPVISIGGNRGGSISVREINESGGIDARLENFHYDVKYEVTGFNLIVLDSLNMYEQSTKGSAFSERQKALLLKLRPHQYLFIKDIMVIGPEGKTRDMNDMIFTIKE